MEANSFGFQSLTLGSKGLCQIWSRMLVFASDTCERGSQDGVTPAESLEACLFKPCMLTFDNAY